jgi:hypothetical protein
MYHIRLHFVPRLRMRGAISTNPHSATIKNAWSYASTNPYLIIAWCLIQHKDNSTFTLCFIRFQFLHFFILFVFDIILLFLQNFPLQFEFYLPF